MNLLKRINSLLPVPVAARATPQALSELRQIGNEITLYPSDNGERYITKGYQLNDAVFSIVSKNAEKAGQIRLYHSVIKKSERKTLQEYNLLTKGALGPEVRKELRMMRKAMVEDQMPDSPLSKLLNKPTRWQTQAMWIEQIFGLRELQGEGNLWLNAPDGERPLELMVIPKPHLNLVGDGLNPWEILGYKFVLDGSEVTWQTDEVVRWIYSNPTALSSTLDHLRGFAPLRAGMIMLQGMNEADKRVATSNANGGASGLAYRTGGQTLTTDQALNVRSQFDNAINSTDMAGKIAVMGGEWGYINFGVSIKDQQLIEQYGTSFKRLCRMFKTPAGIFDEGNATWDNQKQFYRQWIYQKIAPNLYGLTSMLNDALLPRFGLDPETNLIDCDVMSLPELSEDLKEQIAALKDAWWLTPNEVRMKMSEEPSTNPNMDKHYLPSGHQLLDDAAGGLGDDVANDPLNPDGAL